jgi:hypothetical protein
VDYQKNQKIEKNIMPTNQQARSNTFKKKMTATTTGNQA